jgi:hypothetical protein
MNRLMPMPHLPFPFPFLLHPRLRPLPCSLFSASYSMFIHSYSSLNSISFPIRLRPRLSLSPPSAPPFPVPRSPFAPFPFPPFKVPLPPAPLTPQSGKWDEQIENGTFPASLKP